MVEINGKRTTVINISMRKDLNLKVDSIENLEDTSKGKGRQRDILGSNFKT